MFALDQFEIAELRSLDERGIVHIYSRPHLVSSHIRTLFQIEHVFTCAVTEMDWGVNSSVGAEVRWPRSFSSWPGHGVGAHSQSVYRGIGKLSRVRPLLRPRRLRIPGAAIGVFHCFRFAESISSRV